MNRNLIIKLAIIIAFAITLNSCWPMYHRKDSDGFGPRDNGNYGPGSS